MVLGPFFRPDQTFTLVVVQCWVSVTSLLRRPQGGGSVCDLPGRGSVLWCVVRGAASRRPRAGAVCRRRAVLPARTPADSCALCCAGADADCSGEPLWARTGGGVGRVTHTAVHKRARPVMVWGVWLAGSVVGVPIKPCRRSPPRSAPAPRRSTSQRVRWRGGEPRHAAAAKFRLAGCAPRGQQAAWRYVLPRARPNSSRS